MINQTNYIPLKEAKSLIISALDQFDQDLGRRAASILGSAERLNIIEVTQAKPRMMQRCRFAKSTLKDVKAAREYIPNISEEFGPHFTRQDNPTDHAIIDYEYNGTALSIIHLAHELGHAIADDIHIENGRSAKKYSPKEHERQAYFIQQIVSSYLKDNIKCMPLKDEDLGRDTLSMSFDRAKQYKKADKILQAVLATTNPTQRRNGILNALDQRHEY